jgi:hypothetical protein
VIYHNEDKCRTHEKLRMEAITTPNIFCACKGVLVINITLFQLSKTQILNKEDSASIIQKTDSTPILAQGIQLTICSLG